MTSLLTACAALTIIAFLHVSCAQQCNTLFAFNGSPYNFSKCAALPVQEAFLAWTFYEENSTLLMAFAGTAPSSSGWVGWGVNPTTPTQMVGTSALIAFQSAVNGSNVLPYMLTREVHGLTEPAVCSPIDLVVETTAVEIQGASISFLAALRLPPNQTTLNHLWNRGPVVNNFQPQQHSLVTEEITGYLTIDMFTAQTFASSGGPPYNFLKRTHGIINTISWGIFLPLGVISARYLRSFTESAWFYVHVCFQTVGYMLGVTGWALGMKLRTDTGVIHASHQNIGITLFVLATLQVFALILRPNPDHKNRRKWNYYHHTLGYTVILLGIINIFVGLHILNPGGHWRSGYAGSLVLMVAVAVVLEIVTWIRYFKKRREEGLP